MSTPQYKMLDLLRQGYDVQAILNQATTIWMGETRLDEERRAYDEQMRARDRRRLGRILNPES